MLQTGESVLTYDPEKTEHRALLASNILELLVEQGFSIDPMFDTNAWEFVCVRNHPVDPSKRIIVYTSIEKSTGAIRDNYRDKIRVIRQSVLNGDPHFRRVARVIRQGEFEDIKSRVFEGIAKAQKQLG